MTKKGSTAKIAAIVVAVMLCVALLTTVLVACSGNTITFEANGGSAVAAVKKTVEKSPETTRDGYKFEGWYTEKELTNKVKFPYTPKKSITLYAKWAEETDADRIAAFYELFGTALANSIGFVGSQPFGIDVNLGAMGVGLNFKAKVDPNNLSAVAANIELVQGDKSVMNFFADDEFLYVTNDNTKKRLKDFKLAAMLGGAGLSGISTGMYGQLLGSVMGLVLKPDESSYNKDGNTYTVEGSLAGISELLGGLNIEGFSIPAEVTDLLASMNLRLKTTIENEYITNLEVTVVTQLGEVAITSDKLQLGNDVEPAITLPSKTDATYDETYGLNFSIEGTASLINKNADYTTSNIANFDYKIYVDYNIFGALRNSFGGNAVGAVGFFGEATQDSKIFIDIYHNCDKGLNEKGLLIPCAFCESKLSAANGSILSIAYSPSDFHGSNDIKIALNAGNIIPKGLLAAVGAGDGLDGMVGSILGDYIGTSIDPAALIASLAKINTNSAPATVAGVAGFDLGSLLNPNVLQIVANAFDLAKSITLNPEGLKVGVTALIDLLANAIPGDMNIGQVAQLFFGKDTDILNVSANAIYGNPSIQNMDMFHKFMTISEDNKDYKNFRKTNNYTPSLTTEFVKGADGNVIISTPSGDISTHDADGKPLPISPSEIKALLANGYVKYNYVNIYGEASSSPIMTKILAINGYDDDKEMIGEKQYVTVITDLVDGGALSSLLNALQALGLAQISLPGAMFETTITLTEADVQFTSSIDTTKEYAYGDTIDASVKATATYFKGTENEVVKEVTISDTNDLTKGKKFNTFLDQNYSYSAYGETYSFTVKAKPDQIIENDVIKANVKLGGVYKGLNYPSLGTPVKYSFDYKSGEATKTVKLDLTASAKFTADPSVVITQNMFDIGGGTLYPNGFDLTFTKPGVFTILVDAKPGTGLIQKYEITVPAEPIAGYTATSTAVSSDMVQVIFGRTNQFAQDLNAKTVVTMGGKELVLGTDYELQTKVGDSYVTLDSLTIKYNQVIPQVIYIKLLNKDYSVNFDDMTIDFFATDFNDYKLFSTTANNIASNYTLSAAAPKSWDLKDSYPTGKYIKLVNTYDMEGVNFALKLEVKEGENWVEKAIGTGDSANFRLIGAGMQFDSDWNEIVRYADTPYVTTNSNGKFSIVIGDMTFANADLYILITDATLLASDFEYRVSLVATNFDNRVATSVTGNDALMHSTK